MDGTRRQKSHRAAIPVIIAVLASVAVLILFSAWNKPLLYDEYVYFAAAGLPTTGDALVAVWQTTTNLNQGVTGVFLMSDYWLLNIFGAHAGALRAPGFVTGALLLTYAGIFLWQRKVSLWALPAIPIVFATQELVLRYVGEARTYMPLAAASIGILAYYSLNSQTRATWWGRATGWSAVLLGVLFHPYFLLYWVAIALFGLMVWKRHQHEWRARKYVNIPLVVTGVAAYTVLGALTWMRGKANAEVDPFNFLPGPLPIEIVAQNLYFLAASPVVVVAVAVAIAAPLAAVFQYRVPMRTVGAVSTPPLLLIVMALFLALGISLSTIVNDFWIFPRQWIASTALVALAAIWLVAEWWKLTAEARSEASSNFPGRVLVGLSAVSVCFLAAPSIVDQADRIASWRERPPATASSQAELRTRLDQGEVLSDPEWISYAQVNLDLGGPVWPEFGRYYSETDWSTFVLTDGSQSQETQ